MKTCTCQHCNGLLEYQEEHRGQMVDCPHCGMETRLFAMPIPKPKAPPKQPAPKNPALERLKWVRQCTCYGWLRDLINIFFWLSIIGAVVTCFDIAFQPVIIGGDFIIAIICGGIASAICVILLVCTRQASFILIDIADTLLIDHAGMIPEPSLPLSEKTSKI